MKLSNSFFGRILIFFGFIITLLAVIASVAAMQAGFLVYMIAFFILYFITRPIFQGIGWLICGPGFDINDNPLYQFLVWLAFVVGCVAIPFMIGNPSL